MKRWIAILLAMLLTLTACGSLQEPSAAEPEEVPVETPQIEPEAEKEPIAEEEPEAEKEPIAEPAPEEVPAGDPKLRGEEATQEEMWYNDQGVLFVPLGKACYVNLDADGKRERVYVYLTEEDGWPTFHVAVNGQPYDHVLDMPDESKLTNPDLWYAITDIDYNDGCKEIALLDTGPSSDFTTTLIAYEDGEARLLGRVSGILDAREQGNFGMPMDVQVYLNGDGVVRAYRRPEYIQTQFYEAEYVLQDGILQQSRDGLYAARAFDGDMANHIRPTMDIPARTAIDGDGIVVLPAGTEFAVTGVTYHDPHNAAEPVWLQIRTADGSVLYLRGDLQWESSDWYQVRYPAMDGCSYGRFELFEGLFMAD